jgi:hypothetical protein
VSPRYGYCRISALACGPTGGHGPIESVCSVCGLWRAEGLNVPQKQRKTGRLHRDGSSDNACHRRCAQHINHVWSFDYCHDRTAPYGRPLKIVSVIDEYTPRCLAIEAARRITARTSCASSGR